jgi:drug/metabolite transporter (DMT)-like permease
MISNPHIPPPGRLLSIAVLCIGIVGISFGSIFVRLCDAPALIIAAYRLTIATVVLIPFQFRKCDVVVKRTSAKTVLCYGLAGLFLALHFATWVTSLKYTSVASSVVLATTNPLFVAVFSWWFLQERISRRAIIGIVVAVIGGIIIARADLGFGQNSLKGDALALMGAVMMSGYLMTGRIVRAGTALIHYVFRVYGIAAVLLIGYSMWTEPNWFHFSGYTYLFFVLSALVPQSIGHTAVNWALRYFPAALVAVCILCEPVGASLLALLIFKEALTAQRVLGGLMVLAGILLSISRARPTEMTP